MNIAPISHKSKAWVVMASHEDSDISGEKTKKKKKSATVIQLKTSQSAKKSTVKLCETWRETWKILFNFLREFSVSESSRTTSPCLRFNN